MALILINVGGPKNTLAGSSGSNRFQPKYSDFIYFAVQHQATRPASKPNSLIKIKAVRGTQRTYSKKGATDYRRVREAHISPRTVLRFSEQGVRIKGGCR